MTLPTTDTYTIDPPMPVPPSKRVRRKYPYNKLGVGESFFVTDKLSATNAVCCARVWATREANGWKFVMRVVEGGHRVWRTA